MIVIGAPCERLATALTEAYRNESAKSNAELASYYAELAQHVGQAIENITAVESIYNTLEIEVKFDRRIYNISFKKFKVDR